MYLWRQSWIVKKKETARGLKAGIAGMLAALHGFKAARSCLETCTMLRNDTENCSLHCRMRHWFHCLAPSQQWVNGEHYSTITLNRRRMMQMVSSRASIKTQIISVVGMKMPRSFEFSQPEVMMFTWICFLATQAACAVCPLVCQI